MTGLATEPRRLHPLTPIAQAGRVAPPAFFGLAIVAGGDLPGGPLVKALLLAAMALLIVAVVAGFTYVSWTRTRFWFDDDGDLRIASGVLRRQERRLQLSRLQAVDVVQPLVARLVGLAEIKPEVAGGDSGKVSLAFLAEADAQALRNELLARAAGVRTGEQEVAPQAPERVLVKVPPRDLALSLLISESLIAGVVIGVIVIVVTVVTRGVRRARRPAPRCGGTGRRHGQRLPRQLRLHGRRVTGRAPAAPRAPDHPRPDRAARSRAGDRDLPAPAVAALRLGARPRQRRRLRLRRPERGREHACSSRSLPSPSRTPCSHACSRASRSSGCRSSPRPRPHADARRSSSRAWLPDMTTRSSWRAAVGWCVGCP